ncbi:beige/beach-related [Holotrichia oblita]|uniref:Beige/beach-related n=1 Tax=Holotrichia oblita TaxID=644536 RepID=A0ACB9TBV8_HOLOL|nr:beige/beach-related [Holotrichia oblita]
MDKGRFSLLLLDPGEIYFEDFSAVFVTSDVTSTNYDYKKQDGRLKLCSKSLVFEPKDISKPLIKLPLKECKVIEEWKGKSKFIKSNAILNIICNRYIEMLEGNEITPYKFCDYGKFLFLLNYANINDCLSQILQLQRASTLPPLEQSNMISAIVNSRHAGVEFNPLWLDLYEKIIMETQGEKIDPLIRNPGRIILTNTKFYFQPYNNIEIGLEIYSKEIDKTAEIYIALPNQKSRDDLYDCILIQSDLKLETTEKDVMTLKWQNGIVSNYDYLMYINSLGDRTVNDLTQYPVFPWVLSDYTSSSIDLNEPDLYRDLTKPIGALNPSRLEKLMDRYNEMPEPKYMYGSHYSTPGFVLYYLVRLYPQYMLCLQNGRFDLPDRMFNSCADVYKNCLNNMADFKELIPQFYDIEAEGKFLLNSKGINFGYRDNGVKVGDVKLPPWADNPKHFVQILREALESDIVSKNLHSWIDLIFGYKQRGEEAVAASNVFHYMCYEGNVDLDSITDMHQRHPLEVQIMEFGQVPKQVFNVPHPHRKVGQMLLEVDQVTTTVVENDIECDKYQPWKNFTSIECVTKFHTHKGPISCIHMSDDSDKVISVGQDSRMKIFSIINNRQMRSANIGNMPLSGCVEVPKLNTVMVSSWDNSIKMYDLDFGRVTQSVEAHEDAITCMIWGDKSNLLCTGSSDCTVRVWRGFNEHGTIKPIQCLICQLDHNSEVTCLGFDPQNLYLAVGTEDGEVYVWSMPDRNLHRKYQVHEASVKSLCYSPDGDKLATCGSDKSFKVLDLQTGMSVYTKTMDSVLRCLKWDGFLLLLGNEDGVLFVWDIIEVKLLYQNKIHEGE